MTDPGSVQVVLPGSLAELAGGARTLRFDPTPATVAELLDQLGRDHPLLARRLRDETGALRRHVNVYVDGTDVRDAHGLETAVGRGAVVQVLPSIAGGAATAAG